MENGKDISRPVDRLTIGEKEYKLQFDNNAFRIAEDVYELYYGRSLNFAQIAQQLAAGKLGAIMAMMYGALSAGGTEMPWKEFSASFTLSGIPGIKEALVKGVEQALPEVKGKGGDPAEDPR